MMPLQLSRSLRRRITVGVWIVGMLLATLLIARRPTAQVRGLAWAEPLVVTAPANGFLEVFQVALHQHVEAGHLVVRFETTDLEARHRVLLAEIESLSASQTADREGRARLLERDGEEASLELGALSARVRENEAILETLREQLATHQRAYREGVVPEERVLEQEREIRVVETRLAADRERLNLARRSATRASSRAASASGPNQWLTETARRELEEVEQQIGQLSLFSAIDGQVTEVYRRAGEYVRAGEPVLRISPNRAEEVHAWLQSSVPPQLATGMEAAVRQASGNRSPGIVHSVGVERLQMPQALWSRMDTPEWGYLVRISIEGASLAPGEPVAIALTPR